MKKTSALALAIAGTIAAPAAMAESGFYMSARLGAEMNSSDDKTDEALTFGSKSSRMGWRMETDLGNGMTAYGKYELSIPSGSVRDLFAGVKGGFGDVKIAENGYAAFYNHVTGPVDQPYWIGGIGFVQNGRSSNFISYSGGSDAFSFEATIEADGTDATKAPDGNTSISGWQLGGTIALGDWGIGIGARNAEDSLNSPTNKVVSGLTASGNLGDIYIAATYQQDDIDKGIHAHVGFGPFFVNFGQFDDDVLGVKPQSVGVGYARSIGRNTTFWAEAETVDNKDSGPDTQVVIATLRYDWN